MQYIQRRFPAAVFGLIMVISAATSAGDSISADQQEFFEARIRPVLVEHCYQCHNSTSTAEGSLAIDSRDALRNGGDSGPVIVPGKPDQSRLIKVIRHEIADQKMPQDGPKLDQQIVRDFSRWIAMGAPDPRDQPPTAEELEKTTSWEAIFAKRKTWWSFQPIRHVKPPQTRNETGSANPLDSFIFANLEARGLTPVEHADRHTLVRRLYFALIGLPPAPKEIAEFLADDKHGAYERLVDRLLDSQHFGERWARHWMDWIRYAESHGSEGDPVIVNAHLYRDYLIRALNDDVPYNQLVREHVAGDLLEQPRLDRKRGINESVIGTAHWRMVFHGFAPTDALDEKVRFTDDQINTFSKAFLGLTVSCARCHNHKFDAISQQDYYALFGILGSTRPGRTAIETPERLGQHRSELANLKPRIRAAVAKDWLAAAPKLKEQLLDASGLWREAKNANQLLHTWFLMRRDVKQPEDFAVVWRQRADQWAESLRQELGYEQHKFKRRWRLDDPETFRQWFRYGIGLNAKPAPPGEFSVASVGDQALVGVYPGGVYSHLLSNKHAATLTSADVSLDDDYELWLRVLGDGEAMARYVVQNYPRRGTVYPVTILKGGRWKWQKYDLSYWNGDEIHIELTTARDAALLVKNRDRSWFGIREAVIVKKGEPGPPNESSEPLDPLFKAMAEDRPTNFDELSDGFVAALTTAIEAWRDNTASNSETVFLDRCIDQKLLPNELHQLPNARPLIESYRELEAEVPVATRIPSLAEWCGQDQVLFKRGNHKQPGAKTPRRFLEAVDASPYQSAISGRRELAEDLLRSDNPLVRRVIVNRVWHHLFGRGIVATPDNFGKLGATPTHPDLLDYLATQFAQDGWSLKKLIRRIVTSKTWRLSSRPSVSAAKKDSENRWFSHFRVLRLDAEAIRDSLLAVSGKLDRTLNGAPVDGRSNRRSVYVRVIRNNLDPMLSVFDAPVPFSAKGRREATNVPAQSLLLMNNPFVIDAAERFAAKVTNNPVLSDAARIDSIWRTALGRSASDAEQVAATTFLNDLRERYRLTADERTDLDANIKKRQAEIEAVLKPIRRRLLAAIKEGGRRPLELKPIARWDFSRSLKDTVGVMHAQTHDGAHLENGSLLLDGKGWVSTVASDHSLRAKTLEARIILNTLNQRGGGVMTVQTLDGSVFDSIVFAERRPRRWMAGSNNFRRTQDFNGTDETHVNSTAVHLAIVYDKDGEVRCYRNGAPYGKTYRTALQTFAKGKYQVVFGMRHGVGSGGNRMLRGRILQAALYDRALSVEEIQAAASGNPIVTRTQVLAELDEDPRNQVLRLEGEIADLQTRRRAMGEPQEPSHAWSNLTHSVFNLKEFIYVR